ncbi:hypothetical protein M514_16865 [Trichuris suis]|uniref:Uncharacterized protein n=1 Tax=Trichuris suis TaxID=68888 RepID=A0A085NNR8_9BILA|nr:hypothetical protein M514_16865 [Trichuris suis]
MSSGRNLLMEEMLGTLYSVQIPSEISRSLISHENMDGRQRLYRFMAAITSGNDFFGLDPPILPGLMEPVSRHLQMVYA